jgi:ferredoxin
MKIEIDTDKCIASGACVAACPEVFDQDEDGLVVVVDPSPPVELHEKVRQAAAACPAAVIVTE